MYTSSEVKNTVIRALEHRAECNKQAIENNTARVYDLYLTNETVRVTDCRLSNNYLDRYSNLKFTWGMSESERLSKVNDILYNIIKDIKKK